MRTWFISGASRGFGALIAAEALAAGDAVAATARNPKAALATIGPHANLLTLPLDVTDEAQAQAAAGATIKRFGRVDVLLNNAGFGLLGAIEEATPEEIERLFRTNVFGLLAVTRAVLPHMRAQRSGHIINFSSIGGYRGAAGFGVYSATKFAVEGLSEALGQELAPLGVNVTVIEPGYFRTDFLDMRSLAASPRRITDYDASAGAVRERATRVNHAQPGDPARLAKAVLKLVNAPRPPFRIPFGSDAVAAITAKNAAVETELAQWRQLSISTDFPTSS